MDATAVKQVQRKMWSIGDYPEIATHIQSAADVVVEEIAPAAGDDLLDVATGTGNVAIPAAARGANVTGLDLTPELFDAARARAAEAGVQVEWVEGDAEDLPFDDASFDKITSTFGVMFAPRHQVAADELLRVARPGATIAIAAWTPEGMNGRMFATVGAHMPPPPEGFQPPVLWGTEDHVRELLGDGAELTFDCRNVLFERESPAASLEYFQDRLGPMLMAREALEPQGKWEALRNDLLELYESFNEADDGTFRADAEYLLTIARVPS